jgi:predicted component of type VI protein secretion system
MAHLFFLMTEPGQTDRILIWDTRTLSIGRASENDLTLEDDEISRKHAQLVNEGGVFEIGDYRTGNGTFVNGERVRGKQKIAPGDVIGVGKLQLEFREGEEHPAKLGHKLEYASQLKTAGMLPQGADAGTTMLGLADTAPPTDEFVIEPQRSEGGQAFMVGGESHDEFQVRELGDSLDQIDLEIDDSLELMDINDSPTPSEPVSPAPEQSPPSPPAPPQAQASRPAPRQARASRPAPRQAQPSRPAPRQNRPTPPAPDQNSQTATAVDPMERMRKLKVLHDEGLITDAEFQAKRAEILKEM